MLENIKRDGWFFPRSHRNAVAFCILALFLSIQRTRVAVLFFYDDRVQNGSYRIAAHPDGLSYTFNLTLATEEAFSLLCVVVDNNFLNPATRRDA